MKGTSNPSEPALADDILEGAGAIARFIFGPNAHPRRAYRAVQSGRLPVFKIGNRLCARKSRLMRWIYEQEDS